MVAETDVRKDKTTDYPEFIQEMRKLVDKYSETLKKDDALFIFGNIGETGVCLSSGRTLSQVSGLAQIMEMKEEVFNMIAHAIIQYLKTKGNISYTCALLSSIMDNTCQIPEMSKLYEKLNVGFLETYNQEQARRKKLN